MLKLFCCEIEGGKISIVCLCPCCISIAVSGYVPLSASFHVCTYLRMLSYRFYLSKEVLCFSMHISFRRSCAAGWWVGRLAVWLAGVTGSFSSCWCTPSVQLQDLRSRRASTSGPLRALEVCRGWKLTERVPGRREDTETAGREASQSSSLTMGGWPAAWLYSLFSASASASAGVAPLSVLECLTGCGCASLRAAACASRVCKSPAPPGFVYVSYSQSSAYSVGTAGFSP